MNMEIVTRKNQETGLDEKYLLTTGTLISIESTSKTTQKNAKPYGFFNAKIDGRVSGGIAYDAVVKSVGREACVAGEDVQVEALVEDIKAGHNNRWKIALSTTESLSDGITDFLGSL